MAFPNFDNWREHLPPKVRLAGDDLSAQMQGFLGTEHRADGSHGDISTGDIDAAGTITIASPDDFIRGETENAHGNRTPAFVLTQADNSLILAADKLARVGINTGGVRRATFGVSTITGTETQLDFATAILGNLRLTGQGDYTAPPGLPLFAEGNAPRYSYYRLNAAGSVYGGIQQLDPAEGARGHVIVVNNVTTHGITFLHEDLGTTAFMRFATPTTRDCIIGAGGTIVVVYDMALLRWRIVSVSAGAGITYTPAWTSDGAPTAVVTGTIEGRFQHRGDTITLVVRQNFGADTFGSGNYFWSVPVNIGFGGGLLAMAVDASTGRWYSGVGRQASANQVAIMSTNPVGAPSIWGQTEPFPWASGDALIFSGEYFAG